MSKLHMLTTIDNKYSPVTQWDDWFAFDSAQGYHTPGLLARMTLTSDELSELDQDIALETAILEIIQENTSGLYKMVEVPDENEIQIQDS